MRSANRRLAPLEKAALRTRALKRVLHLRDGYTRREYAAELAAARASGWHGRVVIGGPLMTFDEWEALYCTR